MCCVEETHPTFKVAPQIQEYFPWFMKVFNGLSETRAKALFPYFVEAVQEGHITTCHQVAAFSAQLAHESGGLRYFEEWASGEAYNGRKDLGNIYPGDGPRFKGRGPIQLTGRHNYHSAGADLGLDLESNPESVSLPSVGFRTAVWYWTKHNLNKYCDGTYNSFVTLTKRINGGTNGLDDRLEKWYAIKKDLQCDASTTELSSKLPQAYDTDRGHSDDSDNVNAAAVVLVVFVVCAVLGAAMAAAWYRKRQVEDVFDDQTELIAQTPHAKHQSSNYDSVSSQII